MFKTIRTFKSLPFDFVRFIVLGFFVITVLTGCSSSGSGDDDPVVNEPVISEQVLQGVLVDSPVQGVHYETATQAGITDSEGHFMYQEGEAVSFSIGDTMLGSAKGQEIITPVHLVDGALDETHPAVTNMARFMQSLDADGNPNNGIAISEQVRNEMAGQHIDFHLDMTEFENHPDVKAVFDNLNANNAFHDGNHGLVTSEQAQQHLRDYMNPGVINTDTDDMKPETDTDDTVHEADKDDMMPGTDTDDTVHEVEKDDMMPGTDTDDTVHEVDNDDMKPETDTDDTVHEVDNDDMIPGPDTDDTVHEVEKDDMMPGTDTDDTVHEVDNDDMIPAEIKTGMFVDSPVEGLNFETATQSGITDAEGRFTYMDGETVAFSIGDVMLGRCPAQEILGPVNLVDGAVDVNHQAVTNMARFMQSLDADGNLDNGITIPPQAASEIMGRNIMFDYDIEEFENNSEVTGFFDRMSELGVYPHGGYMMYSPEQAQQHMTEYMNFSWDDATNDTTGWGNGMMPGGNGMMPGWTDNDDTDTMPGWGNGMMPGWTDDVSTTLTSNSIDAEPDMSSIDENFWSQVQGINVSVMPMMTPELWGQFNNVELKSVHTDSTLYIHARWKDDSPNLSKKMWQKTGEGWQQASEDEDRLGIAWDINGELTSSFGSSGGMGMGMMQGGCAVLCHVNPSEPSKLTMSTSRVGGIVDLWHWKSSRTNPAGYSDDQYFDNEDHKNDSGSGAYADNITEDGLVPSHMFTGGTGSSPVLLESEAVAFDDGLFASGDSLPAYMLKNPSGDRADVQAKGVWTDGYWTVVLKRSLDTGSATDVSFASGTSNPFAISVFNNAGDEKHLKSYLLNLYLQ